MFLFGHIGITLGAAVIATGLITRRNRPASRQKDLPQPELHSDETSSIRKRVSRLKSWTMSPGKFLDIRLLIIGSILPDIIDKPIGMFLFGNGRVFTHSLLVTLFLLLVGGYLYLNHKQTGVIAIGIGTFTHLIFDQIWLTPNILFWPLLGWGFTEGVRTNYIPGRLSILFSNPYVYVSEAIGLLVVLGFIWMLIRERVFKVFILRGKLTSRNIKI